MSKNRNRAKLNKAFNNNQDKILWIREEYGFYWEETWNTWPKTNNKERWSRNFWGKKIYQYQYRMYRSWKHNRKTQWK